jgi:hypothetical protein
MSHSGQIYLQNLQKVLNGPLEMSSPCKKLKVTIDIFMKIVKKDTVWFLAFTAPWQ